MSDTTEVPFGDDPSETATLLLAAAEDLDLDPGVVQTTSTGFRAPAEVVDKAGVHTVNPDEQKASRRATRKSTAKRTTNGKS